MYIHWFLFNKMVLKLYLNQKTKIWVLVLFILFPDCFSGAYTSDPEKCPWECKFISAFSNNSKKTSMEWEGKERGAKK